MGLVTSVCLMFGDLYGICVIRLLVGCCGFCMVWGAAGSSGSGLGFLDGCGFDRFCGFWCLLVLGCVDVNWRFGDFGPVSSGFDLPDA